MTQNGNNFTQSSKNYKKSVKRISAFFFLVIITVFVLVVLNIADLFSSILTNRASLFYGSKINIDNCFYYALSIANYNNEEEAKKASTKVLVNGGAGYVYLYGDFYVLTSIYKNREDAEGVKIKLDEDGAYCKIINIRTPVINIDYKGEFEKECKKVFSEFDNLYQTLYDLSIEYDSGNITSTNIKKQIKTISINFSQKISDFDAIVKKEQQGFQCKIKDAMLKCSIVLDSLLTLPTTGLEFNGYIKNSYCQIIEIYNNLSKNI